jgi:hypothetical protein
MGFTLLKQSDNEISFGGPGGWEFDFENGIDFEYSLVWQE